MRMVAEGVNTAAPLLALAREHQIEMPITEQVDAILNSGKSPTGRYSRHHGPASKSASSSPQKMSDFSSSSTKVPVAYARRGLLPAPLSTSGSLKMNSRDAAGCQKPAGNTWRAGRVRILWLVLGALLLVSALPNWSIPPPGFCSLARKSWWDTEARSSKPT